MSTFEIWVLVGLGLSVLLLAAIVVRLGELNRNVWALGNAIFQELQRVRGDRNAGTDAESVQTAVETVSHNTKRVEQAVEALKLSVSSDTKNVEQAVRLLHHEVSRVATRL